MLPLERDGNNQLSTVSWKNFLYCFIVIGVFLIISLSFGFNWMIIVQGIINTINLTLGWSDEWIFNGLIFFPIALIIIFFCLRWVIRRNKPIFED